MDLESDTLYPGLFQMAPGSNDIEILGLTDDITTLKLTSLFSMPNTKVIEELHSCRRCSKGVGDKTYYCETFTFSGSVYSHYFCSSGCKFEWESDELGETSETEN